MYDCGCFSHGGFLTRLGLDRVVQQNSLEGLAPRGDSAYIDKVGSVSALVEGEGAFWPDDEVIEQQYRRFTHGS